MTNDCSMEGLNLAEAVDPAGEVLKEEEMFFISRCDGSVPEGNRSGLGLYYQDTRFLNILQLSISGREPVFLSAVTRDSHFAQIELTNREIAAGDFSLPPQMLHLRLLRILEHGLWQRLRLINFNDQKVEISLEIKVGADYLDIFQVRGFERRRMGRLLPPRTGKNEVVFAYRGLDRVIRSTRISFWPHPAELEITGDGSALARFRFALTPKKKHYLYMRATPAVGTEPSTAGAAAVRADRVFSRALEARLKVYEEWKKQCAGFESDNSFVNRLLARGVTDIYSLCAHYPGLGSVIEAGVPWYAAPFGRDALITSWQMLLVNPGLARETLRFLARLQGRKSDPWRDEEPGKIMHELRRGEMAACNEIPHTPYYGSVDSTLWFIILLSETFRWTGDKNLVVELLPALEAALEWCLRYGDRDGDGFIEYMTESDRGLVNQGWKDSWDGVVDPCGRIPKGPIALVEVQGYYYLALMRSAEIYRHLGQPERAALLEGRAGELQRRFLDVFWREEAGFPAFALDGDKQRIETIVSNPGHCLFTGILPPDLARRVAGRLFAPDMYSGWGIRTMSKDERAYNPMSYHNGSVWPHDNAIIAVGLRACRMPHLYTRLVTDLYQAALTFPYFRLPELFCGFTRRGNASPVHYPVACNPQAWAVGAMFQLFQVMLGIFCRGREVHVVSPHLPEWINELVIRNIAAGDGRVDLEFTRKDDRTYCNVLRVSGPVKVIFETEE